MKENTIRSCLLLIIDTEIREMKSKPNQIKINSKTSSQLSKQYASPSITFLNPLISNSINHSMVLVHKTNKQIYKAQTYNKLKLRKKASSHYLNLLYLKEKKGDMKKKSISFKTKKNNKLVYLSPFEVLSFRTENKNEAISYLKTLADEIINRSNKDKDNDDDVHSCSSEDADDFDLVIVNDTSFIAKDYVNTKKNKKKNCCTTSLGKSVKKKKRQRRGSYEYNMSWNLYNNKFFNKKNEMNESSSECSSNRETEEEFNVKLHLMCDSDIAIGIEEKEEE